MFGATRVVFRILLGAMHLGGFNQAVTLSRLPSYPQEKDVLGFSDSKKKKLVVRGATQYSYCKAKKEIIRGGLK
jgi:hypothetical protein